MSISTADTFKEARKHPKQRSKGRRDNGNFEILTTSLPRRRETKGRMTDSLNPEWRVILAEDGSIVYHNDKTGEESKESPYLSKLNKYKDCDVKIW